MSVESDVFRNLGDDELWEFIYDFRLLTIGLLSRYALPRIILLDDDNNPSHQFFIDKIKNSDTVATIYIPFSAIRRRRLRGETYDADIADVVLQALTETYLDELLNSDQISELEHESLVRYFRHVGRDDFSELP